MSPILLKNWRNAENQYFHSLLFERIRPIIDKNQPKSR